MADREVNIRVNDEGFEAANEKVEKLNEAISKLTTNVNTLNKALDTLGKNSETIKSNIADASKSLTTPRHEEYDEPPDEPKISDQYYQDKNNRWHDRKNKNAFVKEDVVFGRTQNKQIDERKSSYAEQGREISRVLPYVQRNQLINDPKGMLPSNIIPVLANMLEETKATGKETVTNFDRFGQEIETLIIESSTRGVSSKAAYRADLPKKKFSIHTHPQHLPISRPDMKSSEDRASGSHEEEFYGLALTPRAISGIKIGRTGLPPTFIRKYKERVDPLTNELMRSLGGIENLHKITREQEDKYYDAVTKHLTEVAKLTSTKNHPVDIIDIPLEKLGLLDKQEKQETTQPIEEQEKTPTPVKKEKKPATLPITPPKTTVPEPEIPEPQYGADRPYGKPQHKQPRVPTPEHDPPANQSKGPDLPTVIRPKPPTALTQEQKDKIKEQAEGTSELFDILKFQFPKITSSKSTDITKFLTALHKQLGEGYELQFKEAGTKRVKGGDVFTSDIAVRTKQRVSDADKVRKALDKVLLNLIDSLPEFGLLPNEGQPANEYTRLSRTNVDSLQKLDVVKPSFRQNWKDKGFMKAIKEMGGDIGKTMDNLTNKSGALGKIGWQFTSLAMSSLGVYFSLLGIVNMIQRGLSAIFNPLANTQGLVQNYAMAMAQFSRTGEGTLNMDQYLQNLGMSMDEVVEGSMRLQGVQGALSFMFGAFGAKVMMDPETWGHILNIVQQIQDVLTDEEVFTLVKSVFAELDKNMPAIIDGVTWLMTLIKDYLLPNTKYFATAWAASLIVMPIASFASAVANVAKLIGGMIGLAINAGKYLKAAFAVETVTGFSEAMATTQSHALIGGTASGTIFGTAFAVAAGVGLGLVGVMILDQLGVLKTVRQAGSDVGNFLQNKPRTILEEEEHEWWDIPAAITGKPTFKADGGPLQAGQIAVVGERGPEVIIPRGPVDVIPNHNVRFLANGTGASLTAGQDLKDNTKATEANTRSNIDLKEAFTNLVPDLKNIGGSGSGYGVPSGTGFVSDGLNAVASNGGPTPADMNKKRAFIIKQGGRTSVLPATTSRTSGWAARNNYEMGDGSDAPIIPDELNDKGSLLDGIPLPTGGIAAGVLTAGAIGKHVMGGLPDYDISGKTKSAYTAARKSRLATALKPDRFDKASNRWRDVKTGKYVKHTPLTTRIAQGASKIPAGLSSKASGLTSTLKTLPRQAASKIPGLASRAGTGIASRLNPITAGLLFAKDIGIGAEVGGPTDEELLSGAPESIQEQYRANQAEKVASTSTIPQSTVPTSSPMRVGKSGAWQDLESGKIKDYAANLSESKREAHEDAKEQIGQTAAVKDGVERLNDKFDISLQMAKAGNSTRTSGSGGPSGSGGSGTGGGGGPMPFHKPVSGTFDDLADKWGPEGTGWEGYEVPKPTGGPGGAGATGGQPSVGGYGGNGNPYNAGGTGNNKVTRTDQGVWYTDFTGRKIKVNGANANMTDDQVRQLAAEQGAITSANAGGINYNAWTDPWSMGESDAEKIAPGSRKQTATVDNMLIDVYAQDGDRSIYGKKSQQQFKEAYESKQKASDLMNLSSQDWLQQNQESGTFETDPETGDVYKIYPNGTRVKWREADQPSIPQAKVGGMISKTGLIGAHSGEVIAPFEKITDLISGIVSSGIPKISMGGPSTDGATIYGTPASSPSMGNDVTINITINGNADKTVTDDMIRKIKKELFGRGVSL